MGLNLRRRRTAVAAALVSALRRPIRARSADASSVRRPAPRRDLDRAARVLHAVRAALSYRHITVSITVYDSGPSRTCSSPTYTSDGEPNEPPDAATPQGPPPDRPGQDRWDWQWEWNGQDPDQDH